MTAKKPLLILALLLFFGLTSGSALAAPPDGLTIRYFGPDDNVRRALDLIPEAAFVERLDAAQVVVINGASLTEDEAEAIGQAVNEGQGMVLLLGPQLTVPALQAILGSDVTWEERTGAQTVQGVPGLDDSLIAQVTWNSAPQVRERSMLTGLDLEALVKTYETSETVLGRTKLGQGTAYVITAWLSGENNPHFKDWPYFNYLVYHLAVRAAGGLPDAYADYAASPVPHAAARRAVIAVLVLMLATTVAAYLVLRRYALMHPEALERITVASEEVKDDAWEDIGFHRPLAGFLFLMAVGLVLFVPLMGYQAFVLPRFLLPWPQAMGAWDWVVRFFEVFWLIFDVGTSLAMVKYFSEYRIKEPRRGLKYIQFFVWWQAISGTIQLGGVALIAVTFVPKTAVAYLSFYFVAHALIQFPGFLRVFSYTFRSFQRFDYEQMLTLVIYMGPMVVQSVMVGIMRRWGAANPILGEAMGSVLGMGLGLYLVEYAGFIVGLWLYKRLGYSLRAIFLPTFNWETVRSALLFGGKLTLGSAFAPLGHALQVSLIATYMLNYAEVQGNWSVAYGLTIGYGALSAGLYDGLMPAISEAYSHGRLKLSQYYVAQGFKFGVWFSLFILSALGAVADRFILGALGQDWTRAAAMVGPLLIWGAVQFPSWFGDRLQQAAGRPELQALMIAGEQIVRIFLMFMLIRRYQLWGLLIAYLIALPTKSVIAWLLNWKLILRPKIYLWQSFVAPLLAGAVNYLVIRLVGGFIWRGDMVTSLIIFFLALLPSLPFYSFLTGLFGGWDDQGVQELKRAVDMSSLARPVAYLVYKGIVLGARLSPLHGRFPITIYSEAMAEARGLMAAAVFSSPPLAAAPGAQPAPVSPT